jgi:hypothetical protein
MADVYAVFGFLLALGIAFPGLLAAVWLLFPNKVNLSRARIQATPWRCFWLGLAVAFVLGIPIAILLALPFAPAKLIGSFILILVLTFSIVGAAGLALEMADRVQGNANGKLKSVPAFVGSAVALELAAFFPFIGWFVVIPLGIVVSLGSTTFAIFHWMPREEQAAEPAQGIVADPQGV